MQSIYSALKRTLLLSFLKTPCNALTQSTFIYEQNNPTSAVR